MMIVTDDGGGYDDDSDVVVSSYIWRHIPQNVSNKREQTYNTYLIIITIFSVGRLCGSDKSDIRRGDGHISLIFSLA